MICSEAQSYLPRQSFHLIVFLSTQGSDLRSMRRRTDFRLQPFWLLFVEILLLKCRCGMKHFERSTLMKMTEEYKFKI